MRQKTIKWKIIAAVISVLITALIWQKGLQDSLDRPSVAPKLSLKQQEVSIVASSSLPEKIRTFLIGENPELTIKDTLKKYPLNEITDRERLVLASITKSIDARAEILKEPFKNDYFLPIKKFLLEESTFTKPIETLNSIEKYKSDPFLYRVSCKAILSQEYCFDNKSSRYAVLKLFLLQFFPVFATFVGLILVIRQAWLLFRKKTKKVVDISLFPLTTVDMILLISGGFVVLGEIILPTIVVPLSSLLTKGLSGPLDSSIKIFIGYVSMTIPPLFILKRQINTFQSSDEPLGGWLQWKIKPLNSALISAIKGWFMVMPFVLFSGWLITVLFGDQGGSNPLLDLVLNSKDKTALIILLITTIGLAPFFEELIFRGALLPALYNKVGNSWSIIISALVFALAHLSIGELPALFVLGVGLGVLRVNSGRLFPCALMHSLWNAITFANLLLLA